jgi:hypothetical protein
MQEDRTNSSLKAINDQLSNIEEGLQVLKDELESIKLPSLRSIGRPVESLPRIEANPQDRALGDSSAGPADPLVQPS